MFLEIATVPGALLGSTLTVLLTHADLDQALLIALGFVLLAIVPGSIARRNEGTPTGVVPDRRSRKLGFAGEYYDEALQKNVAYQAADTDPALGVMFGAGLVSGMFGIGAGVFKVLALDRFLRSRSRSRPRPVTS